MLTSHDKFDTTKQNQTIMRTQIFTSISFACIAISSITSCTTEQSVPSGRTPDYVYTTELSQIRLGDGVPLDMDISVRYHSDDSIGFFHRFGSKHQYDSLVVIPKATEIANSVAIRYTDVDSIFGGRRQYFVVDLKESMKEGLAEEGIIIDEVMVAQIYFPTSYTDAMEKVAMLERKMEAIEQQSIIDKKQAEAARKRAIDEGKIQIERAKADGELAQINAEAEEKRRLSRLAKAKTESQIREMKAKDDAKRLELLAEAEKNKKAALYSLEVKQKRELQQVDLEKQEALAQMEFKKEKDLAELCMQNPAYASFLVNRELAGKVQMAILPSSGDASMFSNVLQNGMK